MAEQGKPNELVTFQELAVSNADEIAALVALLERTGILTHAEVPLEGLEMWLLRRVAQAVEAGEVPAELLADLQSELAAVRERPPELPSRLSPRKTQHRPWHLSRPSRG